MLAVSVVLLLAVTDSDGIILSGECEIGACREKGGGREGIAHSGAAVLWLTLTRVSACCVLFAARRCANSARHV